MGTMRAWMSLGAELAMRCAHCLLPDNGEHSFNPTA